MIKKQTEKISAKQLLLLKFKKMPVRAYICFCIAVVFHLKYCKMLSLWIEGCWIKKYQFQSSSSLTNIFVLFGVIFPTYDYFLRTSYTWLTFWVRFSGIYSLNVWWSITCVFVIYLFWVILGMLAPIIMKGCCKHVSHTDVTYTEIYRVYLEA